ncbi:hypothetical protein [Methylobacterium ajmalii]|uniref:hypothetical protein n=1 Tax=Methylobacterium ajmalii TaxID=2738439 RepID=UPI0019099DEF|nr:hypothetical protein [Methylobacterium ajmalii]MBK3398052.1 hypothetical protein [Methylobacterium ajmalii]MBK3406916.1 hypothetical protein [Methylobacterium ajmalii]MBK3422630.1 hypothetical protein [Methylobacterium ajmalii]MBZ6416719.1 helix-turn-helix domain-containing protein [Methylobacterium sp.]
MTASAPKPRREVKVDLTGLTERQLSLRTRVIRLGECIFGVRWQSDLAAALAKEARRPVGQAQVAHWISGRRPVPEALAPAIESLAHKLAEQLLHRYDIVMADWPKPLPRRDAKALDPLRP